MQGFHRSHRNNWTACVRFQQRRLRTLISSIGTTEPYLASAFVPAPDNKRIFSNYTQRAFNVKLAKLLAIIGINPQDDVILAPYPVASPSASPNQTIVAEGLLSALLCPATETIRLRNSNSLSTYRYLFAGNFSSIPPRPWLGAYHSAKLALIFGTFDDFCGAGPILENQTSIAMQNAWVAPAMEGASGLTTTGWQPYKIGGGTVRKFGARVAVRDSSIANLEAQCTGAIPAS